MAENNGMNTHPAWEDWVGFGLGALIILTPYLTADAISQTVQPADYNFPLTPIYTAPAATQTVQLATAFIGLLVLFAAFVERLQISEGAGEPASEWGEVLEAGLGAALIALPFLLGYANSGTLRYWHFALGAIVFLLAIVELRRDYVGEMQRHGWWRQTQ
ncbi:MAG: hypothetical protein ACLPJW_02820 [Rhodomicrobium sp.]